MTGEAKLPRHAEWLKSLERDISEDYERLHMGAREDAQRAGHGGESTWSQILERWLPSSYRVVTRKYIVPETDAHPAGETDIVVLNPSYPRELAVRHEILFGGVAAAFSVRLTLDADGIRDGVSRAVNIRRGMATRFGSPRDEMLAPFPVGLLAHSHAWKSHKAATLGNITRNLRSRDNELAQHPRESLDFLCVADSGFWQTVRVPLHPDALDRSTTAGEATEIAISGIGKMKQNEVFGPVAALITHLLIRLSYSDPALAPLAKSLRVMGTHGITPVEKPRHWPINEVYSDGARNQLVAHLFKQGDDFHGAAYY